MLFLHHTAQAHFGLRISALFRLSGIRLSVFGFTASLRSRAQTLEQLDSGLHRDGESFFSRGTTAFAQAQPMEFQRMNPGEAGLFQGPSGAIERAAVNDHDVVGVLGFGQQRFHPSPNPREAGHFAKLPLR